MMQLSSFFHLFPSTQHHRDQHFVTYYSNPHTYWKILFFILSLSRYTPLTMAGVGGGDWFKILISVCHSIPSQSCEGERGGGGTDNGCIYGNSLMKHRLLGRRGRYCSTLVLTGQSNSSKTMRDTPNVLSCSICVCLMTLQDWAFVWHFDRHWVLTAMSYQTRTQLSSCRTVPCLLGLLTHRYFSFPQAISSIRTHKNKDGTQVTW
jgi:hypothetical protein